MLKLIRNKRIHKLPNHPLAMNYLTDINLEIKVQIQFIKEEREHLQQILQCFEQGTPSHQALIRKIGVCISIEQNMYALRVMALQMLKN